VQTVEIGISFIFFNIKYEYNITLKKLDFLELFVPCCSFQSSSINNKNIQMSCWCVFI